MLRHLPAVLLLLVACNPLIAQDEPAETSTGMAGEPATTSTGGPVATTSPIPDPPETTDQTFDPTSGDRGTTSECGFVICDETGAPNPMECDLLQQDCPDQEKCNPWADNGGSFWNAFRCVPIDPNPDDVGEPCTVEGSATSGIDSCVLGAMCWDVDPDSGLGHCTPHCTGSYDAPTCDDPQRVCTIGGDGVLALCIAQCDPLDPDACQEAEGCYPVDDWFTCAPDASGPDGGLFEVCEYINACDAGLMCTDAQSISACDESAAGCCTAYCNIDDPVCPDPTTCMPFFPKDQVPPGLESVGVCLEFAP